MTRVQQERFFNEEEYLRLKGCYQLDEALLQANYARCVRIPMRAEARSLNLANSVAIVLYEALRQQDFPGLSEAGRLHSLPTPEEKEWRDYL